jgi:hypothetical protein
LGERELVPIYMAGRLKMALALEKVFDGAGLDYAVETDSYLSGLRFLTERTGAFFAPIPGVRPKRTDCFRRTASGRTTRRNPVGRNKTQPASSI